MIPLQTLFTPTLRITELEVDAAAMRVHLSGRREGFIGWLLHLLGLGTTTTVRMDASGMHMEEDGFRGHTVTYVPRIQVAETVYAMSKPVEWLVLGLVLALEGLLGFTTGMIGKAGGFAYMQLIPLVLGVLLICVYFFARKRVVLGIVSTAGTAESVKLRVSPSELEQLQEAIRIYEALIQSGGEPASLPPPRATAAAAPAADKGTIRLTCPNCQAEHQFPAAARGKKVRCTACQEVFKAPE